MKHIIIGTAGHIDHGKSALVEALTGTHPDRLEEEKRRGITIDLGFAFLEHEGVRFGFVDVPGHEHFVKNMLAGVGGIDVVLLVVAADESIKPQTREHFDICRLLAIPRGLVAITKADLAGEEQLALVRLEVEEFLHGSFLDGAAILPVSSRTGRGIAELKRELARIAAEVPARDSSSFFRLPVDRVFTMKGFGTVVTGTLLSGSVKPEDEAELFPSRRRARIRGVQSGGQRSSQAVAGQRTALNLAGIQPQELRRGVVLATPGLFEPTQRMDARLHLLASARPLKNRARVHFHQGSTECLAEVILLERGELAPGDSCFAQLRLQEATLLLPGDRFIIRQFSPVVTIGGGMALDPQAPRHSRKEPHSSPLLEAFERGPRSRVLAELLAFSERRHPGGLSLARVAARTGWTPEQARAATLDLEQQGRIRLLEGPDRVGVIAGVAAFAECARRVREAVERFHAQNPLQPGISREDLRRQAAGHPGQADLFAAVLAELAARGELAQSGEFVKRAGREISLSSEEQRARQQIEQAFAGAGLAAPSVRDVLATLPVESARAQKILQLLLREQVLVKVAEELIFHRSSLESLRSLLAGYKREKGARISVPAFKDLAGVTRKYAIPLLEYLDRSGVTCRHGDQRIIL